MHELQQIRSRRDGDIAEQNQTAPWNEGSTSHNPGFSGYTERQVDDRPQPEPANSYLIDKEPGQSETITSTGGNGAPDEPLRQRRKSFGFRPWFFGLGKNRFSREVPWDGVRDHLALERTFLGWLRTSGAFAMTGVLLAQISVIVLKDEAMAQQMGFEPKPAANHDKYSSMPPIHRAAKPLAAATVSIALATVTIGVFRFHFSQKALIEGYAISGGWLMFGLAGMMLSFLIVVFVLTIASSDP